MRRGIAALSILTVGLALTACSSGSTPSDTSTGTAPAETSAPATSAAASGSITIWCDDTRSAVMKQLGDKYAAQTGVKVTVVEKANDKLRDDFVKQAPSGSAADVLVGANDWTGKLVQNGVISPLQLGDKTSEFESVAIKAMTYESQVYGVPYAIENIAMVRNTDLAPNAPTSMDDAIKTGQQLVKDGKAKYPFLIQQDPTNGDPYHLYPLQTSFGAPVFTMGADGSYDSTKLAMGGDNGTKFAEYLKKLGDEGVLKTTITADVAKDAFMSGQAPYMITGPWNTSDFTTQGPAKGLKNYVVEEIPSAGAEKSQPFVGVQGFFVSQFSKNPLAANDFVTNYLASKDAQLDLYKVAGRGPALVAAAEDPSVTSDAVIAAFAKVGQNGVPMPNIPAMDAVWTDWGSTEVKIETGKGDPASLWTAMVDATQKQIDKG